MAVGVGLFRSLIARVFRVRQAVPPPPVLDEYVDSFPSPQNAIDLVHGWNHMLPPEIGVTAGAAKLYADGRIVWALEQFGNISGRRILELGPLEASHTYMLHRQGPALIHAIEANKLAFMRCLIAKNLLQLDSAYFMLGDFEKWLEGTPEHYDLIIASGVLYHMADPVRLIELASQRSDSLYLWTHFFAEEEMPKGDARRQAFSEEVAIRPFKGLDIRLHKRGYHGAWRDKSFCGGIHDEHCWMEKDQILAVLKAAGYQDIRLAHESKANPNGPSISIFARRIT
ncbi:MAG TPA: class I SAM-dependent methyltransferase [Reyranella sp.]|nr:class I SAM-dependent methyltransferase [Reyranella sp.]